MKARILRLTSTLIAVCLFGFASKFGSSPALAQSPVNKTTTNSPTADSPTPKSPTNNAAPNNLAPQTAPPELLQSPADLGVPFSRYSVKDSLGRTITFYLSAPPKQSAPDTTAPDTTAPKGLPLILFIEGSGCQSLFQKVGDRIGGGLHYLLLMSARGKARLLVVEKPGVQFLDQPNQPGTAEGASAEFCQQHTLPRWAEANRAALVAAWSLSGVDRTRTLAVGHSEGGLVAARVSRLLPNVTHVASLAGGGPVQLFSLAEGRAKPMPGDQPGDSERRVQALYREWADVLKDPESSTQMWMGHPYRRWSTFLSTSLVAELKSSKARIYIAQGGQDKAVPPSGHDVLLAELKAAGRDVTELRIPDADHGFSTPTDTAGSGDGLKKVFDEVVTWFSSDSK